MKIIKKISLVFIGIILSLILLEAGLQIAGFTLTAIKKYKNKITKDPNTVTILCLGESTTDKQWPPILQKILDEKSKNKKFNVIDEGHSARNTEYLYYEIVEKKLSKYNPDIVISMIGANDAISNKPYIMQNEHWYYKLRIYRLIVLIQDHFEKKIKYVELNNADKNFNIPDYEIKNIEDLAYMDKSKNEEILYIVKNFIDKYKDIYWYESMTHALVNPYVTEVILKRQDKYIFNIDDFLQYYNLDITHLELSKVYTFFAKKFFEQNDIYNAVRCAKTALIYNNNCISFLEEIMKFDSKTIPNDKIYKYKEGEQYHITPTIYKNIISYSYRNDIKYYIVMQYPTLFIKNLKQDLKDSPYYDKLIFISNEENFKQSLKIHKTEEIFRDMFGGSFGHCTKLGNTLIAENVAETILKLYN